MINKLEILLNEIFLKIFFYLSWDEILISLWSINERVNSIICSIFQINKIGIVLNKTDLSHKKFSKILLPLMFNSLSLYSNIKYIYFNEINSVSFDFTYQEIYFRNLKSINITKCLLS
ncbi:unnamed protein product [Adineta steineri]|uniref:F-box domain-containing protein n=1 Tax=Adineta steineri TaxID=433720 RepID=A0A814KKU2_9BILA|nr:unnamed protein product [Adineta steineri]CAF1306855.1 unnamed protein product [Adineta steineri]CAF4019852.1 unnamed protein product [Adineta steineri]CAF4024780.1 unnamed protein product [Adineta steineri]